ncbi:Protein GVQW3 [Anthophora quadrimaculata]
MDKKKFRVLIKHCFLMGKNTVEAKQWLDKCYGDSVPGKSTIIDWYAEFKRGRTNTDDAERSGRPKSAVVPENIKKVHKIVLKDRKMKLREIADTLKISEGSVFTILHENLSMRKLLSKWVPRLLTPDQKQQRLGDSERCLELFKRDKKDFLRRYVTMDETWIHYYTPE